MKKILFILTFIFTAALSAQEIKVSGVVTDESKATLPGTTILVKGTKKGTTTDADGNTPSLHKREVFYNFLT